MMKFIGHTVFASCLLLPAATAAQDVEPDRRSFLSGSLAYSERYGATLGGEVVALDQIAPNTDLRVAGKVDKRGYSLSTQFAKTSGEALPQFPARPALRFEASTDVHTQSDQAYKTSLYGAAAIADWALQSNANLELRYSLSRSSIYGVAATTSPLVSAETGAQIASGLGVTITYDTMDFGVLPQSGAYVSATAQAFGLGGTAKWTAVSLGGGAAFPVGGSGSLIVEGGFGIAQGFGGYKMRVTDRAMAGGTGPRGFAYGGIGPADTNGTNTTHLGGKKFASATVEMRLPLHKFGNSQIIGHAFADAGSVWGLEQTTGGFLANVDDSAFANRSVGLGLSWKGPAGVFSVTYAKPLAKRTTDIVEPIQFGFSTNF